MKRPGLTEPMRRALEQFASGAYVCGINLTTLLRLRDAGLIESLTGPITPRGQAALAAPRVTAAELAMLEALRRNDFDPRGGALVWAGTLSTAEQRTLRNLVGKKLAKYYGWRPPGLTKAGTTALNNVRAASGSSPDWRET